MFRRSVILLGDIVKSSQHTLKAQRCASISAQCFSATAPNANEDIKFEIKRDGKRLKGAEYEEAVLSVIQGEDKSLIPKPAFDVLLKEYDTLLDEAFEATDKYKRSLAETENVRRRGIKQTEDAKVFAIQGFCKDLLEVADILDIAVKSVKDEDLSAGGKPLKDLFEGVSMTRTVLLKTFEKHGLVAVDPTNEKFDPNMHEAVFQIPAANAKQKPGFIEVCTKIGFTLKDRPVRPAQVGVVTD
ncbi:unnamed protein product [Caenorhabditis bovis]|uniref:GrpE protein homolog n=1 Tax=Caenorhabditis bovis TaxID=2654633 RepID=A0A8S1EP70_9PELO|nr:unnamed protein product [Caenorhabditis bovis]